MTADIPLLSQTAPAWNAQPYDHLDGKTVGQKGCGLTALAMALGYLAKSDGFQIGGVDPGTLNEFLKAGTGRYANGGVNWTAAVRDATATGSPFVQGTATKKFKFNDLGGTKDATLDQGVALQALDRGLCGSTGTPSSPVAHPVIIAVRGGGCAGNGKYPGHFVLVTGKTRRPNGTYSYQVKDPGCASKTTLDDYKASNGKFEFQTRGVVQDPDGDLSALNLFANPNARILMTNSSGARTGFEESTRWRLEEIPESTEFEDALDDDDTGAPAAQFTHIVDVFQPASGDYMVRVLGGDDTPTRLTVRAYRADGAPLPPLVLTGARGAGVTTVFRLSFLKSGDGSIAGGLQTYGMVNARHDVGSVRVDWTPLPDATGYTVERRSAGGAFSPIGSTLAFTYFDQTAQDGSAYVYRVRATTPEGSFTTPPDFAYVGPFTQDPLIPGSAKVRAQHLGELRTAANAVRDLAGLPAISWSVTGLGGKPVRAAHLLEIQGALTAAFQVFGSVLGFSASPPSAGMPVTALHVRELREALR